MSNKNKTTANLSLILGMIGFLAGIGLLYSESWMIGIFGALASAGLAYKVFLEMKSQKGTEITKDTA